MQTVFCREGDCVQLPLRAIRKTNGSGHGQCVFMPRALLKASQNKNEESGEGWRFPKEILPDLDSSFLWSIMSAGGSITLLPP